jgi:hypothetical protein
MKDEGNYCGTLKKSLGIGGNLRKLEETCGNIGN